MQEGPQPLDLTKHASPSCRTWPRNQFKASLFPFAIFQPVSQKSILTVSGHNSRLFGRDAVPVAHVHHDHEAADIDAYTATLCDVDTGSIVVVRRLPPDFAVSVLASVLVCHR